MKEIFRSRAISKSFAILCAGLLAVAGAPPRADARSHAAILGNPGSGADSGCFNFITQFGSVTQTCADTKTWIIAPVYDNAGGMNVRISVFSTELRSVVCRARSVDHLGLNLVIGTEAASSARFSLQEITSSLPHAHGFGGVQVNCDMMQGTELINVHY